MDIKKNIYKDYCIYFLDEKFLELGKNIIDKKLKVIKEIKKTKRNYVSKIEYKEKYYILKSPKNEQLKIQKKILTFFKKGEALTTFLNINKLLNKDIRHFAVPYLAIVKRKYRIIKESYLVLECIQEDEPFSFEKLEEILNVSNVLFENSIYHGDFNLSNILLQKNNTIKLIDTQGKRCFFNNYRHNYDLLTLEESIYRENGISGKFGKMDFYKKNISYYIAYNIKKWKKILKK